jgi:hypothetical protein
MKTHENINIFRTRKHQNQHQQAWGGRKCQKRHKKHLETSHVFQFFLFYLLGFGTGDNLHLVLMEKNISFFCPFLRNEENMQKALKKYTGTKQMKQHVHM